MKLKGKVGTALLSVGLVVLAVGLCGNTASCGTNYHKAAVAADTIGSTLHTIEDVNHANIAAGTETAAEGANIANYVKAVATANQGFVTQLQTCPGQTSATCALSSFNTLTATVTELKTQGILRLKSTDAQATFNTAMSAIAAMVAIITPLVTGTSELAPPDTSPLLEHAALKREFSLTPAYLTSS